MTYDYTTMPVPTRFVPQVTDLLARLYSAESDGTATSGQRLGPGDIIDVDPAAASGIIWTQEQYLALLDKEVLSSNRIIAFMDALKVGEDHAETLPEIAERTEFTHEELASALRWLGKFTANEDLFGESVWCFEYGTRFEDDVRWSTYWFEPNQQEAWARVRSIHESQ